MEMNNEQIKLTSSELSVLFGSYLNDTLGICTISYFLNHVESPEIKSCLEYAIDLAKTHIKIVKDIFKMEGLPVPYGFTEQDVNVNAPRLYSDELMLYYIQNMGAMGLNTYSVALPNSSRVDIRNFYTSCLESSAQLYNRSTSILQDKGIYIRPPNIPYPRHSEYVNKQHFLAGWFGDKRPLTSIEISFLFMNLYRNTLGSALLTGFAQVAHSKEVREYMTRGAGISQHHCAVFGKFLGESNLPTPVSWSLTTTASKEQVFSDKLLMFHTAALNNAGIGFYGASIGGSPRRDLASAYSRLIVEVAEFAEDGANIMISNGWLEKPPTAPNRKDLARG